MTVLNLICLPSSPYKLSKEPPPLETAPISSMTFTLPTPPEVICLEVAINRILTILRLDGALRFSANSHKNDG